MLMLMINSPPRKLKSDRARKKRKVKKVVTQKLQRAKMMKTQRAWLSTTSKS